MVVVVVVMVVVVVAAGVHNLVGQLVNPVAEGVVVACTLSR